MRDGDAIYAKSFRIIRAEADLTAFTPRESELAVRMIHAAGLVALARDIRFSSSFVTAAESALHAGKTIFCDAEMVAHGITRARLPCDNAVVCTLRDPRTPDLAAALGTTRSAAAVELWGDALDGALVVIGNAPTALFHLLDKIAAGSARPAAIIGMPVGFVGAAESKQALSDADDIPYAVVRGRLGGSAVAAACVNAVAKR